MFTVTDKNTGVEYGTTFTYGNALALESMVLKLNPELELVVVVKERAS